MSVIETQLVRTHASNTRHEKIINVKHIPLRASNFDAKVTAFSINQISNIKIQKEMAQCPRRRRSSSSSSTGSSSSGSSSETDSSSSSSGSSSSSSSGSSTASSSRSRSEKRRQPKTHRRRSGMRKNAGREEKRSRSQKSKHFRRSRAPTPVHASKKASVSLTSGRRSARSRVLTVFFLSIFFHCHFIFFLCPGMPFKPNPTFSLQNAT